MGLLQVYLYVVLSFLIHTTMTLHECYGLVANMTDYLNILRWSRSLSLSYHPRRVRKVKTSL